MGVGDVALEGRALDLLDRQRREDERVAAERLAIGGEHRAAVALDLAGERVELRGRSAASCGGASSVGVSFTPLRARGRPLFVTGRFFWGMNAL